ncbi:MAG: CRISPR-associated protein Cas4 [Chloroflexota bacterium]
MAGAILAAVVLLGAALLALVWAGRLRAASGVPDGDIVSQDTAGEERGKPLYSARYGLTGTPDYIVKTSRGLVPVEVKPGRTDAEPHESHLLQVLAYCLLLEEAEGRPPPHGLLRYSSNTFKVDYNSETRSYLLSVMDEMRLAAEESEVHRNHDNPQRCRACGYRSICEESLYDA